MSRRPFIVFTGSSAGSGKAALIDLVLRGSSSDGGVVYSGDFRGVGIEAVDTPTDKERAISSGLRDAVKHMSQRPGVKNVMFGGLVHVLPINQKHIDALQKHEFKDIQDVFEEAGLPIRNFIVVTTLWDQLSSSFSFDEAVEREKEIQSGALNELYAGGVTFYRWGMFNLSQESPFPTRQHFVTPLELLSHLVESWALPTLEQPVSVIAPDSPLDDLKARISALEEEEINREHELARVRLEEQLEYLNGARTPDINTYDSASIPGTNAARRGSVGSGNSIYGYASSSRGRSMVRASADYALDRDDSPGQQLLKEDLYKQLRESHGFPAIPSTNASSRSSSPLLPPLPPQVHPKSEVDRSKSSPKSTLSTRANSLEGQRNSQEKQDMASVHAIRIKETESVTAPVQGTSLLPQVATATIHNSHLTAANDIYHVSFVAEKTPQDQERLDAMASELQQLKEERARLQEKLAEMTSMEEDRTRRKGIFAAGSSTDETKLVMSRREKVLRKLFCL